MNRQQNLALPIIIMFMLFIMISFVTGLQNPFGIIVKEQFGATNFMSQLGNAANFIAYAVMGVPAGILLKRLGYKSTALIGVAVGFIGVSIMFFSGVVESFSIYLIGAFVSGFSMCMLNTVVNPMLNTLGGGGNRGNQLIQIGGTLSSISATIVPVLIGYLIGNVASATITDADPALYIAMGIFALAFIVLSTASIPEPHMTLERSSKGYFRKTLSYKHFTLGAVAIFVYVGVEVAIPNFINLFLTTSIEGGGFAMDKTSAGMISGTYWFLMLIGRFVGASVASRVSSRSMLTYVASLGALLTVAALLTPDDITVNMPIINSDLNLVYIQTPIEVLLMVLGGLSTSVMWGGIFNLAVEGLGKFTTTASGIFMVMVCGGGIVPLITGYIADNAGFKLSYIVILIGFIYIFYYAIWGSKNRVKNINI